VLDTEDVKEIALDGHLGTSPTLLIHSPVPLENGHRGTYVKKKIMFILLLKKICLFLNKKSAMKR
jgi:hypothetical protein